MQANTLIEQRGRFCVRGTRRLREKHGRGYCLGNLCVRSGSEMRSLNVKWALESRGWRKEKNKRQEKGRKWATAEPRQTQFPR